MRFILCIIFPILILGWGCFWLPVNSSSIWEPPELLSIPNGEFKYQLVGEFHNEDGVAINPVQTIFLGNNIKIMKYPVNVNDYSLCVSAGECNSVYTEGNNNMPQTGVNYFDASLYAKWVSSITNQTWRLPTHEEWKRIAAERSPTKIQIVYDDIAKNWVEKYKINITTKQFNGNRLRPLGAYGENSLGAVDIAGAVWEWTQTCQLKGEVLNDGSSIRMMSKYCGVRLVEGQHTAFVISFVRDARGGGCSAGTPPDFLGFRLVQESH